MNITHNFAQTSDMLNNQPVSVLPTAFAQKLLTIYAAGLVSTSLSIIQTRLVDSIRNSKTMDDTLVVLNNFITEQAIIKHVTKEDWDAFAVPGEIKAKYEDESEPVVEAWKAKHSDGPIMGDLSQAV